MFLHDAFPVIALRFVSSFCFRLCQAARSACLLLSTTVRPATLTKMDPVDFQQACHGGLQALDRKQSSSRH